MVLVVSTPRGVNEFREQVIPALYPQRPAVTLTLTPVANPQAGVTLELMDSPKLDPGLPRWSEVERPRRQNVLRWDGRSVLRQTFSVMFSGAVDRATGELANVGPRVDQLHALAMPANGSEPPVCYLTGTGYGTSRDYLWQVETLEPGEAWRRGPDGGIGQISYSVGLARYLATDVLVQAILPPSPAAASNARAANATATPAKASTGRTYTVRKGDTLAKIAAAQLGNAARWRELSALNAIPNPNLIYPGRVLKLP